MMFGDSHFFGVAPSVARRCICGILCCKIKILRSEFGGYAAHHLPHPDTSANIQLRSVDRAKSPINPGFFAFLDVQGCPEAIDGAKAEGGIIDIYRIDDAAIAFSSVQLLAAANLTFKVFARRLPTGWKNCGTA